MLIIEPKVFGDARGNFFESWNQAAYEAAGITNQWGQDNESSSRFGVFGFKHILHAFADVVFRHPAILVRNLLQTGDLESLASLDCADEGIKCYALDGDCIRILIYKFSVERDFVVCSDDIQADVELALSAR